MGFPSLYENITEKQQSDQDSVSFGPIPKRSSERTPGGFRRVGPPPTPVAQPKYDDRSGWVRRGFFLYRKDDKSS
jgi:hypothetical protein